MVLGLLFVNSLVAVLFSLVVLIGVPTVVVVAIISWVRGPHIATQDDPEQVLRMRLAQGEIDLDEYERLRGAIRS